MNKRPGFPAQLDKLTASPKRAVVRPAAQGVLPAKTLVAPRSPAVRVQASGVGLDSQAVRLRMVDKLRAQGVADEGVLQAMGQVPRHQFAHWAGTNDLQAQCGGPHDRAVACRPSRQIGAGARNWHGLRVPGCGAESGGAGGLLD